MTLTIQGHYVSGSRRDHGPLVVDLAAIGWDDPIDSISNVDDMLDALGHTEGHVETTFNLEKINRHDKITGRPRDRGRKKDQP